MDNMLNLTDSYWEMLKSLSKDAKLNLIAKLSNSIIETSKDEKVRSSSWSDKYCGAWKDSKSPEDMVAEIKKSRTANSDIEL